MNKYIGFKMVQAEPMNLGEYNKFRGWEILKDECPSREGYKRVYPDGYVSWSPKDIFENSYMQIGDNNTIVQTNVNDFVKDIEYQQWGDKTTIARATLVNGFIITESSSCVDPANFNMDVGAEICKQKIHDEVWKLLGFLLQTANSGIKTDNASLPITSKKKFIDSFNKSSKNKMVVAVKLPTGVELIINNDNLDSKVAYYDKAYNDNLQLNANNDIQIIDYMFL